MPHGKKAASKTPMDAYGDGCRAISISTGHPTRTSRRSSSRPTSRLVNASGSRRHSKPYLPSLERTFKSASLNRVALHSGIQGGEKAVDLCPGNAAILAPIALNEMPSVRLTCIVGRDDRLGYGLLVLLGDVGRGDPTEFCLGVACHFLKGRVCSGVASVRTDQDDANRDAFEEFAPTILAHRQFAIEAGVFQRNRGLRRHQL